MKKVEHYIKEHTKETSTPIIDWNGNIAIYQPWLTPKDARKAVEIAREEMIEEVCEFLDNNLCCYIKAQDFAIEHQRLENDLKQAIKDEYDRRTYPKSL